MTAADPGSAGQVERAFGAENRARLLRRYFDEAADEPVTPESAWRHVYRLLLWIDRTIGLAHCYESDKCQPGRPWYARALRFHQWVSAELASAPDHLARDIDWLFSTATLDLAAAASQRRHALSDRAAEQRAPYASHNMPYPGEDPELEELIRATLAPRLGDPPADLLRELAERIQAHFGTENKRKNLVGEGFEDTIAELLRRIPRIASRHDILVRPALHDLPGFYPPRGGDKTRKVDLALVRRSDETRVLVSCKWSVRSDREEQFATDFDAYSRLEARGTDFEYVLVTNEFDPARLAAACDNRRPNGYLFGSVVHVNSNGPLAAYEAPTSGSGSRRATGGAARATAHIRSGRLASLDAWLTDLSG
jgi:hypothetical protein